MLENNTSNGTQPQHASISLPPVLAFIMGVSVAPREAVERTIEGAIEALDAMDGDPDLEAYGDELDGSMGEDDFHLQNNWRGEPGCPIADPGGCEHDGREPDHDAEVETWAHWMDHATETHIGLRPGNNCSGEAPQ